MFPSEINTDRGEQSITIPDMLNSVKMLEESQKKKWCAERKAKRKAGFEVERERVARRMRSRSKGIEMNKKP
jgi:hypothetical protein